MDERNMNGFFNEENTGNENSTQAPETEAEDIKAAESRAAGTVNMAEAAAGTDEASAAGTGAEEAYETSDMNAYGRNAYGQNAYDQNGNSGYTGNAGRTWNSGRTWNAGHTAYSARGVNNGNTGNAGYSGDAYGYRTQAQSKAKAPEQKTHKSSGTGKKWAVTVAMALVFGLVAGAIMFGVNSLGNSITRNADARTEAGSIDSEKPAGIPEIESTVPSGEKAAERVSSEGLGSVEAVVQQCMPSVVTIATVSVQEMQSWFGGTQQYEAQGGGTGVIVGKNDTELLIATNNHVVQGADSLSVGFIDESSYEAKVKGTDADNDLAVIAVNLEDISEETMSQIRIASLGNSDDLNLGEQVVVIGNSLGVGQSVTTGIVSALGRELSLNDGMNNFVSSDLIQTDAAINSGNSGGALLNMKGELVGINEAKSSYSSSGATVDNVGYAIPISKAEPILEELMALETRDKVDEEAAGYLGVTCKDITSDSDLVTVYGFPEGVCFLEVLQGGPAEAAGLQKGDVLKKFDGRSVDSYNDLKNVLQYYSAGEEVELTVLRQKDGSEEYEEKTVKVTLCDYDTLQRINSAD